MRKSFALIIVFCALFIAGCVGKVNKENYNKISTGMTLSEVEAVLGKGQSLGSSTVDMGDFGGKVNSEIISWQDGKKVISVSFLNGKVQAKAENGL